MASLIVELLKMFMDKIATAIRRDLQVLLAVATGVIAVLLGNKIGLVLAITSYVIAILSGVIVGLYYVFSQGRVYRPTPRHKEAGVMLKMLLERQMQNGTLVLKKQQTVISRNIDVALNEVLDLVIRHHVIAYIEDLVYDHSKFGELIKDDSWLVVKNVRDVLAKIDQVKFVTCKVTKQVCQHYQKIRTSSTGDGKEVKPLFMLHPYLQSTETETEFLRKVSEALIVRLLPPSYSRCEPIRHLLREIFSCAGTVVIIRVGIH